MKRILLFLCLTVGLLAQRGDFSSAFVQFRGLDESSLVAYMNEQAGIGVTSFWTTGTATCPESQWSSSVFFDAQHTWLEREAPALLPVLLAQASRLHAKVYLGLVNSEDCADVSGDAAESAAIVNWVLSTYPQYASALGGWYIPDEIYIEDGRWLAGAAEYCARVVVAVRQHSSLPIVASPYLVSYAPAFGTVPIGDPTTAGATAKSFLDQSHVDILAYEDGMGGRCGSVLGLNTYPTPGDYFLAISAAIGREHLWVIHELFNATLGIDGGFGSASITRVNQQIAMIPDYLISGRISWTAQSYMSAVSPVRYPEAERLLAGYKATHGLGGRQIVPKQAVWFGSESNAAVAIQQFFDQPALTDGKVGDPFAPFSSDWAGAEGASGIWIDLGRPQVVDWVSLHCAKVAAQGVRIPDDLAVWGSADGSTWNWMGARTFVTDSRFDGEWNTGNSTAYGAVVRYLWLYMPNTPGMKTRASEVEVIGR